VVLVVAVCYLDHLNSCLIVYCRSTVAATASAGAASEHSDAAAVAVAVSSSCYSCCIAAAATAICWRRWRCSRWRHVADGAAQDPCGGRTDGRTDVRAWHISRSEHIRAQKSDKRERLELVLIACVGKGAKNGCVVALVHYRHPLIKEGFLAIVTSYLSDAPC